MPPPRLQAELVEALIVLFKFALGLVFGYLTYVILIPNSIPR